jgi:hypothetical protein
MEGFKNEFGEKIFIKTDHPYLQYCGRIGTDEKGWPEFVYPSTFVKLEFVGSAIEVLLENHWAYWNNYIGWILDGVLKKAGIPKKGKVSVILGENLEEGKHSLLLFKRQDSCHTVSLEGFFLSRHGYLLEPEPLPERRLEFYGDSVSAGEVSEALDYVGKEDPVHQGEYSNSWYSYAWLTARMLNARIHNISQGGIALMNGIGWFEPPDYIGMEAVYDKIQYHPAIGKASQWNFENYRPHVVVVAIGQNDSHPEDFMRDDYDGLKAQEWKYHYAGFIGKLRQIYPEAVIILTTTILCHHVNWDRAIGEVQETIGDKKVFHFRYRRNGNGTPGHIRIPEAEEMAEELSGFIKGLGENIWIEETIS